jgi:hypothetical protein
MKRLAPIPKKFQKFKPYNQRMKAGDIVDVHVCARLTGYSEEHVRRICRADGAGAMHERRGRKFFFKPAHVEAILNRVAP